MKTYSLKIVTSSGTEGYYSFSPRYLYEDRELYHTLYDAKCVKSELERQGFTVKIITEKTK